MKTSLKLVAGATAGLLTAVGLVVGMLVWASAEDPSSASASQAEPSDPAPVLETVEMPSMDHELATTHRAAVRRVPPPPQPTLVEQSDPFEPELDASGDLRVERLILATGIRGHEPTGASNELVLGDHDRIYAFVHAVNDSDEAQSLFVTFEPEAGESSGHVSLDIPAERPRWRTWAWTRHVYTPGRWHVVVRTADGHEIARRAFDVVH